MTQLETLVPFAGRGGNKNLNCDKKNVTLRFLKKDGKLYSYCGPCSLWGTVASSSFGGLLYHTPLN